ncbi:MAG TPA: diguanylate cyclase [Armatimonadota bacterium]|nr:diguanylate cyclase [Armatimonadota bacterium]
MGLPEEIRFEDVFPEDDEAVSVLDRLAAATDVLDLLQRADATTPAEIDTWAALVVGERPRLYLHAPRQPSAAMAMALAESMVGELEVCTGRSCQTEGLWRRAQLSCLRLNEEMLHGLAPASRDHVTQRGETVVGLTRAAATDDRALTIDRWRRADEALEVIAWMLGTLSAGPGQRRDVADPITGACTREFFEAMLNHELNRQARMPSELSLALLQFRRSDPVLTDQPVPPAVLAAAADVMMSTLRRSDVVARLDGRRLAAMLPATSPRQGLMAATRLGEALRDRGELDGWSVDIGVSGLGIETADACELMQQAGHAMKAAEQGRAETPFVYV